jgi:hypothetical protein
VLAVTLQPIELWWVVTHVLVISALSMQEGPHVFCVTTAATRAQLVVRTHVLTVILQHIELWWVVTHVLVSSALSMQECRCAYNATTAAIHVPLGIGIHVVVVTLQRIAFWRVPHVPASPAISIRWYLCALTLCIAMTTTQYQAMAAQATTLSNPIIRA